MMRIILSLSVIILLSACGETPHWKTLSENRKSNLSYKIQNYQIGLDHAIEALSTEPFYPELHINLGIGFEGLEQNEKALQAYLAAEKLAKTDQQKFMARFNIAQAYGKAKKIDEALVWYQKALEIEPASKEVKTNIELLIQQQQGGGGQGDNKDQKDKNKDDKKGGQGQDQQKDKKDDKDDKGDKKKDEPKQYQGNQKYKPREFKGELSEGDVKKILGEVRQQEQKIRADFNKKDVKERPRDKDW